MLLIIWPLFIELLIIWQLFIIHSLFIFIGKLKYVLNFQIENTTLQEENDGPHASFSSVVKHNFQVILSPNYIPISYTALYTKMKDAT